MDGRVVYREIAIPGRNRRNYRRGNTNERVLQEDPTFEIHRHGRVLLGFNPEPVMDERFQLARVNSQDIQLAQSYCLPSLC
jgi:hypothetical protein